MRGYEFKEFFLEKKTFSGSGSEEPGLQRDLGGFSGKI